ncbi:MAG: hypothetical protein KGI73_00280 [Patescibacteria group bacterium]|nr:hypothetical protein [Patescibacteria group bacterium]
MTREEYNGYNMAARLTLLAAAFLAFPAFVFAATALPAGFAPGTLWLSKTNLVSGDTATLYTVVYDSSQTPIDGEVSFTADGKALGTAHFSLTAGESAIASVPWNAVEGTHTLGAVVEHVVDHGTNAALSVSNGTAGSISVTVAAAPPPPVAVQYLAGVAAATGAAAEAATPFAEQVANAVTSAAEAVRQSGITALSNDLAQNANQNQNGIVLGTSTENMAAMVGATSPGATGGSSMFQTFYHMLETVLLYIFESPFLFTIFAIVICLGTLWLLSSIFGRFSRRI